MKRERTTLRGLLLCLSWVLVFSLTVHTQEILRFAIIGDFGSGDNNERDVADLVKSWNPEFIITTGDNNYPDGEAATIDRNIGQFYHSFIYPYMGTYGPGASTNRFFPSVGNHDWDNRTGAPLQPYLDYFTLPGNERYYDFVWGPVHFFSLDSDSREPHGITSTSTQAQWLQSRLASSTAQWKIVYLHHPPYSSRTSWAKLQWPYQQWGADMVLAGHAHVYERIILNGFPYITNGLGGDSTGSFSSAAAGSVARFGSNYGAMLATLSSTSITFQFITRNGQVIDTYTMGPDAVPPAAPASLSGALASNDRANLSWTDAAINEDGYRIERSVNGGDFVQIGSVIANTSSFTATGITSGSIYSFRVRGVNNAGFSDYSNTLVLSHGAVTVPNPPSGLSADSIDHQRIALAWTDSSDNESGFMIERCEGTGCTNFAEVAQTATNISEYTDSGLQAETLYRYRVTSYNQAGASAPSNIAEATTEGASGPTEPPTNLAATATSHSEIDLTWTDDSDNEDAFHIERCGGSGCSIFEEIAEVGANQTTLSDNGLSPGTLYRYRVRARAGLEFSSYSNIAEATTHTTGSTPLLADNLMMDRWMPANGSSEFCHDRHRTMIRWCR
jgi:tartrate-resistant acid phosphatase type 5